MSVLAGELPMKEERRIRLDPLSLFACAMEQTRLRDDGVRGRLNHGDAVRSRLMAYEGRDGVVCQGGLDGAGRGSVLGAEGDGARVEKPNDKQHADKRVPAEPEDGPLEEFGLLRNDGKAGNAQREHKKDGFSRRGVGNNFAIHVLPRDEEPWIVVEADAHGFRRGVDAIGCDANDIPVAGKEPRRRRARERCKGIAKAVRRNGEPCRCPLFGHPHGE